MSLARVMMTGLEVTDLLIRLGRQTGLGDRLLRLAQQTEPRLRTAGVSPVNTGTITSARDRALAGPSGVEVAREVPAMVTPPPGVPPVVAAVVEPPAPVFRTTEPEAWTGPDTPTETPESRRRRGEG